MMLEHGVQPQHHHVVGRERLLNAGELRQRLPPAAGTQHLKRLDDHHAPAQTCERDRFRRVESGQDVEFGGEVVGGKGQIHGPRRSINERTYSALHIMTT